VTAPHSGTRLSTGCIPTPNPTDPDPGGTAVAQRLLRIP
jgi:hypothetical protein